MGDLHVKPLARGFWVIIDEKENKEYERIKGPQREAVRRAKAIAKQNGVCVAIHRVDGRKRRTVSYEDKSSISYRLRELHKKNQKYTGYPWRRYIYAQPLHELVDEGVLSAIEDCLGLKKAGSKGVVASRLVRSMHYLTGDEYAYVTSCVYAGLFRMRVAAAARPEWLTRELLEKWIEQLEEEIKSDQKSNRLVIRDIKGFAAGINFAKIHTETDFETWADKLEEISQGYKASTFLRHIKNSKMQR